MAFFSGLSTGNNKEQQLSIRSVTDCKSVNSGSNPDVASNLFNGLWQIAQTALSSGKQ